jgi:hypothetical protein
MVITNGMVCTLSKAQINRLIKKHGKQLSGTISKEKLVYIVLPCDIHDPVDVQDILGNSLGKITVKEAWAL